LPLQRCCWETEARQGRQQFAVLHGSFLRSLAAQEAAGSPVWRPLYSWSVLGLPARQTPPCKRDQCPDKGRELPVYSSRIDPHQFQFILLGTGSRSHIPALITKRQYGRSCLG